LKISREGGDLRRVKLLAIAPTISDDRFNLQMVNFCLIGQI
jgi:hypothetical protein